MTDTTRADPLPRDTARFAMLAPEPRASMAPGAKFPTAQELAQGALDRMVKLQRKGIDGN